MPSQTTSGKGFEYALAKRLAFELNSNITGSPSVSARRHYYSLSAAEQSERDDAAKQAVEFLMQRDARLQSGSVGGVRMQSDRTGVEGDVRDIVVVAGSDDEVGFSAKNRNTAIRNSRLSPTIDFGVNWFGDECSADYFRSISPIFDMLAPLEASNARWRDLPDKNGDVYLPLLKAFIDETRRIFGKGDPDSALRMMRYMLGEKDYYKVYKENGNVIAESFNMAGTLRWGRTLILPTRLADLRLRRLSNTTVDMILDHGWQLSFRIHNATSRIERSLKFDVRIVGQPPSLSRHEIAYR